MENQELHAIKNVENSLIVESMFAIKSVILENALPATLLLKCKRLAHVEKYHLVHLVKLDTLVLIQFRHVMIFAIKFYLAKLTCVK